MSLKYFCKNYNGLLSLLKIEIVFIYLERG